MLTVRDLSAFYGGIAAVRGASLTVAAGKRVALIGSNGAGKTTLLNAICGALRPAAGNILFGEANITGEPAYRVARRGILLVPERRQILGPLTVRENLELGRLALGSRRRGRRASLDTVFDLFPRLAERVEQIAGSPSGGEGRRAMHSPMWIRPLTMRPFSISHPAPPAIRRARCKHTGRCLGICRERNSVSTSFRSRTI
jgi:branched-chain amino acid transport system ATP-binding protein